MSRRDMPHIGGSTSMSSDISGSKSGTSERDAAEDSLYTSIRGAIKMSITQEKRLDSNFGNNNDHNYLHKKFKKVASVAPAATPVQETQRDETLPLNKITTITQSSISNASQEVDKSRAKPVYQNHSAVFTYKENTVQNTLNDNRISASDTHHFDNAIGKTNTEEFRNKTDTQETDLMRDVPNGSSGRYVCPYCKLSCAKPSVLQKHIRAHTNERPYPCVICGFAFKTKSNLYKHCKSRSHALRLQGADVTNTNDDELSPESESDTSPPPPAAADYPPPRELASPDTLAEHSQQHHSVLADSKFKTIYKPKFRAAFYKEANDKHNNKKTFSSNADLLNEHISKIISDNEAIVDVIDTPLQKKYNKIKQIAESQQLQLQENFDLKNDFAPLNLTKTVKENEFSCRKRAHSETNSSLVDSQKHPLNPEGSIIKDLLLKTKANGLLSIATEVEGNGLHYVCPLCQIPYKSADNLEIHRLYYCKGPNSTVHPKDAKTFMRSNSINVRLPETNQNIIAKQLVPVKSPSPRQNKPDNIVIVKQEPCDVIAPLPSPGPLLGNTRLVDTRATNDYANNDKKITMSPKTRNDTFNNRLNDNISPRPIDSYKHAKIRCIDRCPLPMRTYDDIHQKRNNSTSLQMFGGEVKIVDHLGSTTTLRIEPSKNQLSPIIVHNLSPSAIKSEPSNVVVRSGLHSGGTILHTPKEGIISKPQTSKVTITSNHNVSIQNLTRFQFPPLSAITAFNPLTLPPLSPSSNGASSILHGGKLIPHVPGMPGPNSPSLYVETPPVNTKSQTMSDVSELNKANYLNVLQYEKKNEIHRVKSPNYVVSKVDSEKPHFINVIPQRERKILSNSLPVNRNRNDEDKLNIAVKTIIPPQVKSVAVRHSQAPSKRNIDGLPKPTVFKDDALQVNIPKSKVNEKVYITTKTDVKLDQEIRNFNFENLITKAEIFNHQISSSSELQNNTSTVDNLDANERSETSYFQKNSNVKNDSEDRKSKFLRPSTLPLKPGTFTPKRHHGITPNANTMPLVSPETPRPAKAYGQLYLNGNAYTYLGLKCSAKVFYCTINRPQPTYVPNQHFLSMYSNWQLLSELTPDPLGLSAAAAMSLYDSRHRPQNTTVATIKQDLILTHSSQSINNTQILPSLESKRTDEGKLGGLDGSAAAKKELAGGFESNEEYTYIRGRGRGRYVCSECGIRCKKPSMLKKHIRTHTDVRPFTCIHCAFSFKTKGNLTKHMKSKAHYKKCCELGINPNEGTDLEGADVAQCSGETDDDSESDGEEGNEGETESSDTEVGKSRLPEHEAARCLLSLCHTRPTASATPGLITSARPSTYPYTPLGNDVPERSPDVFHNVKDVDGESRIDNEPMDLSKSDVKTPTPAAEITTAGEPSVLASLASNTAKLPQSQTHWSNGEPMLHAYLTERALLDTKIKQSQLSSTHSKVRKLDQDKNMINETANLKALRPVAATSANPIPTTSTFITDDNSNSSSTPELVIEDVKPIIDTDTARSIAAEVKKGRTEGNPENAKFVVSEFLKIAQGECNNDGHNKDHSVDNSNMTAPELAKMEDKDIDTAKLSDHDNVARKVVIGAGGVAFKVKGKEPDSVSSYSQSSLMEDGSRECDFCHKTFTKPSQLRLHLNIHYMERPFKCSACAVSFRTRGHLQKHERSGSHHNKVSMTSTFGAATSLNPRPFRCSDCNIAFRIHGHLAKHLRSKMHVMRLECLFKLPFGTFTEIERAGVSLTDIDTTDCASSLNSLQSLAKQIHEKDPTKLEYRDNMVGKESSEDEECDLGERTFESEKESELRTNENGECTETRSLYSATD